MANQGPQAWPTCAANSTAPATTRTAPAAKWSAPGSYLVNSVNEILGLFVPAR